MYSHIDLDQLKGLSPRMLSCEKRRALLLLIRYFDGTATEEEAHEASETIKNIVRLRELEIRARRKQLREAMSRK